MKITQEDLIKLVHNAKEGKDDKVIEQEVREQIEHQLRLPTKGIYFDVYYDIKTPDGWYCPCVKCNPKEPIEDYRGKLNVR
jgi:hypothetical protein